MSVNGPVNDDGTLVGAPNLFGLEQYSNQGSFFGGAAPAAIISQGRGWGIIIGFSVAFFVIAGLLVWVDKKFGGMKYNNEQFNTAGRTIGPGLIAVDVVSHWTWASIILSTGTYVVFYGAGSAMWYGTGSGTMTVWLFVVVAIELKHRAPKAHTFLELVKVRWGWDAHLIFMFFALFTNLFVSLAMMQAAVQVFATTTGVNQYALSFVIPIGVALYAVLGGLKATFTTSYLHTVLIYVVALLFMFYVYVNKSQGLGSMDAIYDRLLVLQEAYPVGGNRGGSYMTAWSLGIFEINLIYVVTAMSALFCDQSYWQSAIAASPKGAVNGYAIGSYLYLGIVYIFPIGLGLGGLCLDLPINLNEVYGELAFPAQAYALLGQPGAVAINCVIFMAVTSSGSGEMLAVSSLFTFDLYREYFRPKASGPELVTVSRIAVMVWAIIMGGALAFFNGIAVNVYWLTLINGVICGGAVAPVVYLLAWDRCTKLGAAYGGAVLGCLFSVIAWMVYPAVVDDAVTIDTTEKNGPILVASGIGTATGIILPPLITYIQACMGKAPRFDFSRFDTDISFTDKESTGITQEERDFIAKWRVRIWAGTVASFVILEFVWPLLTLPAGNWSRPYFKFQVILGFLIGLSSAFIAIFLPLWEGREDFLAAFNWALGRKQRAREHTRAAIPDGKDPEVMKEGTILDDGRLDEEKPVPLGRAPADYDDSAHGAHAVPPKTDRPPIRYDSAHGAEAFPNAG